MAAARRARAAGRPLHLMGLVSDGGVHSHVDHLRALVELARTGGRGRARVHAITDGRDVSPHQAAGLLAALEAEWADGAARHRAPSAAASCAMDRDRRWERTQQVLRAVVDGGGAPSATAPRPPSQPRYAAGVTDEFVEPA